MFYPLFSLILGGTVFLAVSRGPREALWRSWLVAMLLLPVWLTATSGSLQLDLRTAAAVGALLGFAANPPARGAGRVVLLDVLVAGFVAVVVASQYRSGSFGPLTLPDILRKWLLPYLMGRLFLGSHEDVRRAFPVITAVCMVLSAYAVFEAVTKVNPVNALLGKSYGLLEQGEGYRWGMKRAQGPLDHGIFFGMLLVLILPWTLEAARRARSGEGPAWWKYAPWALGAALFCTVSRGPQMAGLFTLAATFFLRRPGWRLPLALCALALGGLAYGARDQMVGVLGALAGEKEEEARIILIDGEEYEYTGTNHRVLLYVVYADAIAHAGWLGYGYGLAGIELEESVARRFGSIDNHYLRLHLQHGWLAVAGFVAVTAVTLAYLLAMSWDPDAPAAGLAAPMAGAIGGISVTLFSVWLAPDFGVVWLFTAGVAANLRALPAPAPAAAPEPTPVALAPARRRPTGLVPLRPLAQEFHP